MFHSQFDPLPRKTSLRGLTVLVATVLVGTAVAVHGFVESTLGPNGPLVETQVLEPPAWMQEEVAPVQRASTASRRRTTLHTTCPIEVTSRTSSISLSSRTRTTPASQVAPAAPPALPACPSSTGTPADSPAGLSSRSSGS